MPEDIYLTSLLPWRAWCREKGQPSLTALCILLTSRSSETRGLGVALGGRGHTKRDFTRVHQFMQPITEHDTFVSRSVIG